MLLNTLVMYLSLFVVAFLAATLLPGSSEAMLATLVALKPSSTVPLFMAATLGNILGAIVNWLLGGWLARYSDRDWFPIKPAQLKHASDLLQKYGIWILLLSWVPIIGDPLTAAAGFLKVPFWLFVIIVGIGKAARYAFVVGGVRIIENVF